MKSRIFASLLAAAALALALAGCASLAQLGGPVKAPLPTGPDDSLVIIKTVSINPDKVPEGRAYVFNLSGGNPSVYASWKFAAARIGGPGVKLDSISSHVGAGFRGDNASDKLGISLPYEAGRLVVADFVFVQTFTRKDANTIMSSVDFRKITEAERAELYDFFRASEKYAPWMGEEALE